MYTVVECTSEGLNVYREMTVDDIVSMFERMMNGIDDTTRDNVYAQINESYVHDHFQLVNMYVIRDQ